MVLCHQEPLEQRSQPWASHCAMEERFNTACTCVAGANNWDYLGTCSDSLPLPNGGLSCFYSTVLLNRHWGARKLKGFEWHHQALSPLALSGCICWSKKQLWVAGLLSWNELLFGSLREDKHPHLRNIILSGIFGSLSRRAKGNKWTTAEMKLQCSLWSWSFQPKAEQPWWSNIWK